MSLNNDPMWKNQTTAVQKIAWMLKNKLLKKI